MIDVEAGPFELIIENQRLFVDVIDDIVHQIEGNDGQSTLSNKDKPLPLSKYAEVISTYVPFDINQKSLLAKLSNRLCSLAIDEDYYEKAILLVNSVNKFLYDLSNTCEGSIEFSKCNIESIIKATSPCFNNDYASIEETLIDYFELVYCYDRNKVFFLVNLRSFLSDSQCTKFIDTVTRKGYQCIIIESLERSTIVGLDRLIIDKDLCEI